MSGSQIVRTYQRNPVVVHAIQWDGSLVVQKAIEGLVKDCARFSGGQDVAGPYSRLDLWSEKEHQWCQCFQGCWVIKDAHGEVYPFRTDAFRLAYTEVFL